MDTSIYTIGWIAPLALEFTAAIATLDESHGDIQVGDYTYQGGIIREHYVIMGVQSKMGTDAASDLARRMSNAFPNIRLFMVVGIAGGIPSYGPPGASFPMVLGDVVVSVPRGKYGGVVRWDSGACTDDGRLERGGHLNHPPDFVLAAVNILRSRHSTTTGTEMPTLLKDMRLKIANAERSLFEDLGPENDRLFDTSYSHPELHWNEDCENCCDHKLAQLRNNRGDGAVRQKDTPKVHYGNIASSNQLQISSVTRDRLQEELDVICFEMEGAGVIQNHPCLIIRGICDYSDSHKNKKWQPYAAATASVYAKELLGRIPPSNLSRPHLTELNKEDKECVQALRVTDPRDDKQRIEESKGGLFEGSYRWILQNEDFLKWRDDKESRLLWIKGDPGKGKTMLMCGIIDELTQASKHWNISYFFFQATDERLKTASALLRSLIYLIVDQQPSLISHLRKKYDHAGKSLFHDVNGWTALCGIFTNILQDPQLESTFVIIDALDECREEDLERLLELIVHQSSNALRIKWILSSRNWPNIEESLEQASSKIRLSLELNEVAVSAAVTAFIEFKVSQLASAKRYDAKLKTSVLEYLSENSNNTFLWVALVCQNLRKIPKLNVLKKLSTFPPGLDAFYSRMLHQMDLLDESSLCKRIMAIMTVLYQPITLAELAVLEEDFGEVDDLDSIQVIVELCGSFLSVQGGFIYFIHQSAKEFLQNASLVFFPAGIEHAHQLILNRSLQAMSDILRRDLYDLKHPGYYSDILYRPFPDPLEGLRYSCLYWLGHACDASISGAKVNSHAVVNTNPVQVFLEEHYLHWLEALSLCGGVSSGIISIAMLEAQLMAKPERDWFLDFVQDAQRFILYHGRMIEEYPLQVYASALLFSPTDSLVRNHFKKEEPNWAKITPPVDKKWSPCLQTLQDMDHISSVTFSQDSKLIASVSDWSVVKDLDVSSGVLLRSFGCYSENFEEAAPEDMWVQRSMPLCHTLSHDSTRLAILTDGGFLEIWDLIAPEYLQNIEAGTYPFGTTILSTLLSFSTDTKLLVSAICTMNAQDQTTTQIKLWDAANGVCIRILIESHRNVCSLNFSPGSERLIVVYLNEEIEIWDVCEFICLRTFVGGFDQLVTSRVFSKWSGLAWGCGTDDSTQPSTDTPDSMTMSDTDSQVKSLTFSSDSTRVAYVRGMMIVVWDTNAGECLHIFREYDTITSIAFSHDSTRLVSATEPGNIRVWDISGSSSAQSSRGEHTPVDLVAFSPDGKRVATHSKGTISLWDVLSNTLQHSFHFGAEEAQSNVCEIIFSYDSRFLAASRFDGRDMLITVWDTNSGISQTEPSFNIGAVRVYLAAFSLDSNQLACFSSLGITWWDLKTGTQLESVINACDSVVNGEAFSYDLTRMVGDNREGDLELWDVKSNIFITKLKVLKRGRQLPAFSTNSNYLVALDPYRRISVWDAHSGEVLARLRTPNSRFRIQFYDAGISSLRTDSGTFDLGKLYCDMVKEGTAQLVGIGLCPSDHWVTYNGHDLLWIPPDYRRWDQDWDLRWNRKISSSVLDENYLSVVTRSETRWGCRIDARNLPSGIFEESSVEPESNYKAESNHEAGSNHEKESYDDSELIVGTRKIYLRVGSKTESENSEHEDESEDEAETYLKFRLFSDNDEIERVSLNYGSIESWLMEI